jgi:hypothetical protein
MFRPVSGVGVGDMDCFNFMPASEAIFPDDVV